jgi:hypothetical protein
LGENEFCRVGLEEIMRDQLDTTGDYRSFCEVDLQGEYFFEKEVYGYKVATCVMLVSMISTYLVAYSSIIKLMLDQGTFEPAVIK